MTTAGGVARAFLDLGDQHLCALSPGLEEVLPDRREPDEVAGLDVVVPDHRQVIRHVQAEILGRGQDPQGLRVAGGEDGGGSVAGGEHPGRQVARLVASVGAQGDVFGVRGDAGGSEGAPISLEAVPARREPEGVGECVAHESDPPVAEADQVFRGELTTGDVVAQDSRKVGGVLARVDEDDRHVGLLEAEDILVGRRQRHDEQAVGSLPERQALEVVVALLDRLDVVDDEVELAVSEGRIDPAKPLGGLWAGEEGDDHRDRLGLAEAQPASRQARREVELLDDRGDPAFRVFVDQRAAVQGP